MGTIEVPWDRVATLDAVRDFEVVTSDGRGFAGRLERAADRRLAVASVNGTNALDMGEISSIVASDASFRTTLDGSVDAGFNYTRSSGIAQTAVIANSRFRRPTYAIGLTAPITITHPADEVQPDNQGVFELSFERYRRGRWFVGGAGRVESNESLGLALRSLIEGVVGVRLLNTSGAQVEFAGGLAANHEQGVDAEPTSNIEALISLQSSYCTAHHPGTTFDLNVQHYSSLGAFGRYRLQITSSVKREVWRDIHIGVNGYGTADTAPPNAAAARTDVGLAMSVGWSY